MKIETALVQVNDKYTECMANDKFLYLCDDR